MPPVAKLFDLPRKEWTWRNNTFLEPNQLAKFTIYLSRNAKTRKVK